MTSPAIFNNTPVTMTSLEMVEFINGQRKDGAAVLAHADFLKKVPQVLGGGHGNFSDTYKHPQNGQTYPCYRFPKREACLMAMSYSYDLQAKVFDRMSALERGMPAFTLPDFTDPAAAAVAWAEQYREKKAAIEQAEQAQSKLALAAPKAEALDRITLSDGSMCLTNAAKVLGMPPKKFIDWMQQHEWIYRRAGSSKHIGYQSRVQAGYLDHKVTTFSRTDGTEKTVEQVLVTTKGLAKLAQVVGAGGQGGLFGGDAA